MTKKLIILVLLALGMGLFSLSSGLNSHQSLSVAIFAASILGTLFFWDFRLSFAFTGTALLLATRTIDIEHVVMFSSLEVILFLVAMMILVGVLRDEGFFNWITHRLLSVKKLSAVKFVLILSAVSAALSAMVSEAVSIIFMVIMILEICDHFDVDSVPYIIIAVMATNIGSAATVLGNPIGILIAIRSGLTFEDFLAKALPLAVVCLAAALPVCMFWYRKQLAELDRKIREKQGLRRTPVQLGRQMKISVCVFVLTLGLIALHHRLELAFSLEANTLLLAVPLVSAGLVMVWKWRKARHYVEQDVEWWTLLFFLLLFAQAGTLKFTGATDVLAQKLTHAAGSDWPVLTGVILWISSGLSAFLDNVVLVAALLPVVESFRCVQMNTQPLYWALLFGGCLGGNVTLIGSTANIIAVGLLEKKKNIRMTFGRWFGIGLAVGVLTTLVAWLALLFVPVFH